MRPLMLFVLIALIIGFAAACEPADEDTQTPPTVFTLLPPIITETPRFTATLPPSETPTATNTPTPSDTPTPITPSPTVTITPTPPEIAQVISQDDARVRAEPSGNAEILTTIAPGTSVEVHYQSEDQQWYFVRFIDVDGSLVEGWMRINLLNLRNAGTFVPPTIGPSPTVMPTLNPNATATPTLQQTPGEDLSDKNVRANCIQTKEPVPSIGASDTVSIWWSWFVARPELMDDHLAHAQYEVLLNGRLLENYEQYQTPVRRDGDWYVWWYVPVGELAPGRYEVTYRVTWDQKVNDGYQDFGPGTDAEFEEGNCVFTVQE